MLPFCFALPYKICRTSDEMKLAFNVTRREEILSLKARRQVWKERDYAAHPNACSGLLAILQEVGQVPPLVLELVLSPRAYNVDP